MKAHLIQITVIALAIAGALVASPASARPRDPDNFRGPPRSEGDCLWRASYGDPYLGICGSGSPRPATTQPAA